MTKFKLLFIPFFLSFTMLLVGYSAIRWLVDIKFTLISVDEIILDLFLPAALSILVILLVMRKRFRVLEFKHDRSSGFIKMLMMIAIAVPLVISQSLISSISYDLIELETKNSIPEMSNEKFFKINRYPIFPSLAAYGVDFRVRGKNNVDFNMSLSIAVPIDLKKNIWYGIRYSETISNRLEDNEKEALYHKFIQESEAKFEKINYYEHDHFELLKSSNLNDGLLSAIEERYPNKQGQQQFVLYPRNESLVDSNQDLINYLSTFSIISFCMVAFIIAMLKVSSTALQSYQQDKLDESDFTSMILKAVTFRAGSPITSLALNVCIAVFIVGILRGVDPMNANVQELLSFGGVRKDLVLAGDYWRLLSSVFVHAGFAHFIMNVFVLGIAGRSVESVTGSPNFVLLFIISALGSSLASIAWHDHTLSVGISGVNYGLVGAIITLLLTGYIKKKNRSELLALVAIVLGSGIGVLFLPNIDHAAHVGGFVSGLVFTWLMTTWLRKPSFSQQLPTA
ncbi:rhomboid family intramembrane serine protease [Vibrio genomosp. F10]|uniref:rhomboid family intramembrane serine protease n=2 Tax=Vibrio genomosp. F10 TaxID=723171 RepID=UPI0002DF7A21|nr:rhomboid family intramembrane serine protease [Vibrio genomosp. F10]OEF11973.1 rhomboid family intramembrane serine protease [Vibrio genomosp. F10 str. 9ZD137]